MMLIVICRENCCASEGLQPLQGPMSDFIETTSRHIRWF